MKYLNLLAFVKRVLRAGGFASTEPLDSLDRLAHFQGKESVTPHDICSFSHALAEVHQWDRAEAVAMRIQVLEIRGWAFSFLAQKLCDVGNLEQATRVISLITDDPENSDFFEEKAKVLLCIASKHLIDGKVELAKKIGSEVALILILIDSPDRTVALLLDSLAIFYRKLGQQNEALKYWRQAVELLQECIAHSQSFGELDIDSVKVLAEVGIHLVRAGEVEFAKQAVQPIRDILWWESLVPSEYLFLFRG